MKISDLIPKPLSATVVLRGKEQTLTPITGAQRAQIRAAFPRPSAPMTMVNGTAVANEGDGFYQTTMDSWLAKTRAAEFAIAVGLTTADGKTYAEASAPTAWLTEASKIVLDQLTDAEVVVCVGAANEQIAATMRRPEVRGN